MASPSRGPGACSAGSAASGTGISASIASTLRTATTWCGWRPPTAGSGGRPTGRPSSSSGSRAASLYSTGPETPDDACRPGLRREAHGLRNVEVRAHRRDRRRHHQPSREEQRDLDGDARRLPCPGRRAVRERGGSGGGVHGHGQDVLRRRRRVDVRDRLEHACIPRQHAAAHELLQRSRSSREATHRRDQRHVRRRGARARAGLRSSHRRALGAFRPAREQPRAHSGYRRLLPARQAGRVRARQGARVDGRDRQCRRGAALRPREPCRGRCRARERGPRARGTARRQGAAGARPGQAGDSELRERRPPHRPDPRELRPVDPHQDRGPPRGREGLPGETPPALRRSLRDDAVKITKVLVANRGEIAVRVIRACREQGIASVAVFSEADREALHVLMADEAYPIGPPTPAESYLAIDKLVRVAKAAGADAVHPGYGFLAENAGFAEACGAAGLIFVGPPAGAIRALGDKTAARRIARGLGVPTVPGTFEPLSGHDAMRAAAREIGYPLMVKAVLGGGGKGMRLVRAERELESALALARSEAAWAFGDGAVYLERYLAEARHIEVQVLADAQGRVIHLGERECSIQRRHQKLIEESPSPCVDAAMRERMGEAACRIAKAAGYVNAGTVEFLVDADRRFYFLEMNTRLQVEHPVTEMVTGIDLVREQLRIAAGEPLGYTQADVHLRGASIECRINAEDPFTDWRPSPGTITGLRAATGPWVRDDSAAYEGYTVPRSYDTLLPQ